MSSDRITAASRGPGGITLLEVLISCGLLIVGLSTMAAMLPAASSRLTQATTEDRAAVLLSNATAEMFNRGLVAADSFPSPAPASVRTLALGKVLGRLPQFTGLPSGRPGSDYFTVPSDQARGRCGSVRTFVLEDGLIYEPPRYGETPVNAFERDEAGTGPRRFREGVCWGATLTPLTFPPKPGGTALLAIAVFKRESEAESPGQIDDGMPLVLTRVGSCYEAELSLAGSLLRGCSWVLAIPPNTSSSPRWFKIMSSWTWGSGSAKSTRVIMRNQEEFETLTGSAGAGSTATVFAFDGIVRVDEQTVTLE